jgi:hypothetical protein
MVKKRLIIILIGVAIYAVCEHFTYGRFNTGLFNPIIKSKAYTKGFKHGRLAVFKIRKNLSNDEIKVLVDSKMKDSCQYAHGSDDEKDYRKGLRDGIYDGFKFMANQGKVE